MKFISVQEALRRKSARQAAIPELQFHASGHCVHVGKISLGCLKCFVPDAFWNNFRVGNACNAACPYCFGFGGAEKLTAEMKIQLLKKAVTANLDGIIPTISFSGGGETLMHLDLIIEYVEFYRQIENHLKRKPYYYLYTNGWLADRDTLLRLRDLGFDELRFHLGASDFAPAAYANLREAVKHIPAITVETPVWLPQRDKLFAMLPILAEIGVKHLNLGEIEITRENRHRIERALPAGEVYQYHGIHLDDGGLAYELIAQAVREKYPYSVLDCSSLVKSIQRAPGKWVMCEPVEGLVS